MSAMSVPEIESRDNAYDSVPISDIDNIVKWLIAQLPVAAIGGSPYPLVAIMAHANGQFEVRGWEGGHAYPSRDQTSRIEAAVRTLWVLDELHGPDVAAAMFVRDWSVMYDDAPHTPAVAIFDDKFAELALYVNTQAHARA